MFRRTRHTDVETALGGGAWARRAWTAGWLLVSGFLLLKAVPDSLVRKSPIPKHENATRVVNRSSGNPASLDASTLNPGDVWTAADGKRYRLARKNIEDVRPDDIVLAKNPETGQLAAKRVTRNFERVTDHLRVLEIESPDGTRQRIETTNDHPFWVEGRGWVNARDLEPGSQVTHSDGQRATVVCSKFESHPEGVPVYNFEVADLHTYLVAASLGGSPVLVHNTCTPAFRPGRWLSHFESHGAEMGYRTSVEYLRGAQRIIAGGPDVQTFVRANGDRLFYKVKTNEFAVLSNDGFIRTYFAPEEGLRYWLKQIGVLQ